MEVTQNDLAISTQGRGFWLLDKINVLQEISQIETNPYKPHLFNPDPALRTNLGGGWRSGGVSFENDISFYLPNDISLDKINMYIKDKDGNIIVDFKKNTEYLYDVDYDSSKIYAGVHTVYWDLELKAPKIQKDFVSMYYSSRGGYGPEAIPDDYNVELITMDQKYSTTLSVKIDPRWDIPEGDLVKQFNTANEVIDMINESQEKLSEMRNIVSQIKNYIKLTKGKEIHDEIKSLGTNIIEKISSIENNLYQNKIETSQDEINYARKWTNHITHLYDRITTDNQAPNDGMMKRLDELRENYEVFIKPYDEIIDKDLPLFTQFLKDNGVQGVILE